ncbi:hypothetical protein [Burkholderia ubonensis]|uniref:hypothetical protein n=2 Tax=Burkholderia ubonensis TaxID=101571 RepID=UPI000B143059|nr:hypothetical protein [Burkholderia ubonensis]
MASPQALLRRDALTAPFIPCRSTPGGVRIGDRRVVRDARGFANHTGSDVNAELYERDLDTDEPNTTGRPPPQERRGWRRREIDDAEEGPCARVERAMPRKPLRWRHVHKAAAATAFHASALAVEAAMSVAAEAGMKRIAPPLVRATPIHIWS